ncbi:unnamed protein product, partial [marine sediment metagenome]
MKQTYNNINFRSKTLEIIDMANTIIDEYKADGYDLTVRQLYYKFVADDLFPEDRRWSFVNGRWKKDPNGTKNAEPNYKWTGTFINNGRLAGLVDWNSIVDRTRSHKANAHWDSPADILNDSADQYAIDTRADQNDYLEVWVEKDALIDVIGRACDPLDIGYFSCRGYASQSSMWQAAMRFKRQERNGKDCTVLLHLGDHDPSGIDMSRDIQDRLYMFGSRVAVRRIALDMEQIEQYSPPPNPAKTTDSRYANYRDEYGEDSWELDALDPRIITE